MIVYFCWTLCLLALIPLSTLIAEVLLALLPSRSPGPSTRRDPPASTHPGSVAVVVPAHNESSGIAATIAQLRHQLADGNRLLVVADNCSDDTASIARRAGAEVLERQHATLRGKGYALDAAIQFLASDRPPAVVVFVDADCHLQDDGLQQLADRCSSTNRPTQSRNLLRLPSQPGPEAAVSVFAFLVKNWVRPRGLSRLGLPVMLTGTGMAVPWQQIRTAPLASGEIVEDLALGLELLKRGHGATLCESATVWSDLPLNPAAAVTQRTRWEHGYLASMLREVPQLVIHAITQRRPLLLLTALDLAIPPLALLALLSALAASLLFLQAVFTGYWMPFVVLSSIGVASVLVIAAAWWRFARDLVPAGVITSIPLYVLRKLSLYGRFVKRRETAWIRTERD